MKKQISEKVRARMKQLGETYKSVMKGSGVSDHIIAAILGCRGYHVDSLVKILEYLDMSLDVEVEK